MKKISMLSLMLLVSMTMTSCSAIEGIFKAGMWWGIILVVGVIALIIWLISKMLK